MDRPDRPRNARANGLWEHGHMVGKPDQPREVRRAPIGPSLPDRRQAYGSSPLVKSLHRQCCHPSAPHAGNGPAPRRAATPARGQGSAPAAGTMGLTVRGWMRRSPPAQSSATVDSLKLHSRSGSAAGWTLETDKHHLKPNRQRSVEPRHKDKGQRTMSCAGIDRYRCPPSGDVRHLSAR
jgi:hypothetical protein